MVVLEARHGKFRHRFAIGPFSIGPTYDVERIRDIRAARREEGIPSHSWLGKGDGGHLGRGLIRFDYGDRSINIRPDLEPYEAIKVVNILRRYIPGNV